MPSAFRRTLESAYGGALFITALTDECLQIYPMEVWRVIEDKIEGLGYLNPDKRKFVTRTNRYGTEVELDGQGRIPLKQTQRDLVGLEETVVLIGCTDHLELWPAESLTDEKGSQPLTAEDFKVLGI